MKFLIIKQPVISLSLCHLGFSASFKKSLLIPESGYSAVYSRKICVVPSYSGQSPVYLELVFGCVVK